MSTRDRVVVVTGGSAGVGRATVREFAAAGYRLGVVARGSAGLDAAVADVERAGSQGLAVPTDVADDVAVEAAADRVEQEFGPISVWVNAAFCGSLAFAWDTSADCGAKHAVKGFTESVITELAHEHSQVSLCMVQLPGLNTPQFSWNLNRMPKPPMPVPPIYQPEATVGAGIATVGTVAGLLARRR